MPRNINLTRDDPTVFAKCEACDSHAPGASALRYYGRAFKARAWALGPKCENCKGSLTKLFDIPVDAD